MEKLIIKETNLKKKDFIKTQKIERSSFSSSEDVVLEKIKKVSTEKSNKKGKA